MSKDNLIRFIQSVLPMSNAKAEQIVEKFNARKIARGEYLLKEGSVCRDSHIVEEGIIRSYIYDLEGNDVTTAFCTRQMFASDILSFFKRTPSRENIQALTDCQTWYITYDDMQESFHAIPEFREFGRQNIINQYGLLQQRMLSMLQQTAEQRYSDLVYADPAILQHAPLKYIATYLGITDTSLSRIRKDLLKK
jgi:CRP-like cAMP-binding protein